EGDAITRGVSVGVGALGGSQSSTTIHPTVTSYLKAPTVRAGGEIKVHATATPTAGFMPNYQILSTDASDSLLDSNNNTLHVLGHGLSTGDTVLYDNQGHAVIAGLSGPDADGSLRRYSILVTSADDLAFGASFPGEAYTT